MPSLHLILTQRAAQTQREPSLLIAHYSAREKVESTFIPGKCELAARRKRRKSNAGAILPALTRQRGVDKNGTALTSLSLLACLILHIKNVKPRLSITRTSRNQTRKAHPPKFTAITECRRRKAFRRHSMEKSLPSLQRSNYKDINAKSGCYKWESGFRGA